MIDELKNYIDLLFAGTENCDEIKEEILQNTIDRYEDLVSQGKSPQAAYRLAISGIGDISEILGTTTSGNSAESVIQPKPSSKPVWKKVLEAIAVFLYILSPVPLFVLQNELGLCGLLAIVAVATAIIMIASGKRNQATKDAKSSETGKSIGHLMWVVVLAAYLLLSFITDGWYITWIMFPIAASVNGLITALTDKKENVLLRVVLYSLAILILLGILGVGLGIGSFIINFDEVSESYISGSASFKPEDIQNIHVEWASGSITIRPEDTNEIKISEEGATSAENEMVYQLINGTLTIRYSKPNVMVGFFVAAGKHLTITVPEDWSCNEIEFDVASADITINDLTADSIDLDTASGNATFDNCHIREVDLDTASGDVKYDGTLGSISCSAASADLDLVLTNTPNEIDMDCASGNISITLPSDCGFTVRMDSISGKFHSDFPATVSGKRYIYGDGRCQIEMDSASGSIKIYEGK